MSYQAALNAAINGDIPKCFGGKGKPARKVKRDRMMKLVRYLSRSIHGI